MKHFFNYLNLAVYNGWLIINFNNWFVSKEYRKKISETLGVPFTDKGLEFIPEDGKGSSFDKRQYNGIAQQMKVLERYKVFMHDELYLEAMEDEELQALALELFDIHFCDLLSTKEK